MEFKTANREWVKNAAIIFLAVLLVLTFFSNTIMNRSLVEVATARVTDGNIVAKVRGTGTVTASGKHQVKATKTRTVRSVMVKAGQEVQTGDVLFILGEGDGDELEQAEQTLRELRVSYQKAAIALPTFDYTAQNRAVSDAEAKMLDADKAAADAYDLYMLMLKQYGGEDITNQLSKAEAELSEAEEKLDEAREDFNVRYNAALAEVEKWQAKVDELSGLTETAEYTTEEGGETTPGPDYSDESPELQEARKQLANAELKLSQMNEDSDPYISGVKKIYESKKAKYETILKQNNEVFYKVAPYKEAYDKAEEESVTAYNAYSDALSSLEYTQAQNEKTLAAAQIDLANLADQISRQQEKVKSLAGEDGNTITANVSGKIDTIDCTAGDTVTKDSLMCTIEVPDMGHTVSFSVTNDQAQRLRTGDTATVSNYYWGNTITATLTNIRTDPKNPQTNKLLTFDLEGDVTTGSELTLSVGQKSANYDTIVPNSAIRTDNNGSFVLAISQKSSPLGNRYIAKRVSIEVLASDDNNSAVVADLGNGDYVITTGSGPIKNGDQVRMADSSEG